MDKPRSVCCGAEMPMWPESDICPDCKEHTDVEEEQEETNGKPETDIQAD